MQSRSGYPRLSPRNFFAERSLQSEAGWHRVPMETQLVAIVGAFVVLFLLFVSLAANRKEDVDDDMRRLTRRRRH